MSQWRLSSSQYRSSPQFRSVQFSRPENWTVSPREMLTWWRSPTWPRLSSPHWFNQPSDYPGSSQPRLSARSPCRTSSSPRCRTMWSSKCCRKPNNWPPSMTRLVTSPCCVEWRPEWRTKSTPTLPSVPGSPTSARTTSSYCSLTSWRPGAVWRRKFPSTAAVSPLPGL